jgi:hypothetical protein
VITKENVSGTTSPTHPAPQAHPSPDPILPSAFFTANLLPASHESNGARYFAPNPDTNHASSITYTGSNQPLLTRDKPGKGLRHNVAETPSPQAHPSPDPILSSAFFTANLFTSLPISSSPQRLPFLPTAAPPPDRGRVPAIHHPQPLLESGFKTCGRKTKAGCCLHPIMQLMGTAFFLKPSLLLGGMGSSSARFRKHPRLRTARLETRRPRARLCLPAVG